MNKNEALAFFLESYFEDLNERKRTELEEFCQFGSIKQNDVLFWEQQSGHSAYFLASGRFKLIRSNAIGKEVVVAFISPGQLIAWFALMTQGIYPVSAIALQNSEYLSFDIKHLRQLVEIHPSFAWHLFDYVARRQCSLLDSVKELALSEPKTRFLNYLYHLQQGCDGTTISLPESKKQIALLLGISPETLSRILRKLSDEGLIAVQGKNIEILHPVQFFE